MAFIDHQSIFPFTAIVGQERMKLALVLNAVNPGIGGVLIRGEKGTAKSTAVRALAAVLPLIQVVKGCLFSCDPDTPATLCPSCTEKLEKNGALDRVERRVRVVTLPLGATEDRVVGTLDLEKAVREGVAVIEPGLLAAAHRGILYIDEVNLLDDHLVDVLLDAAAMGVNTVEREGISATHPARFILVGTMNPEEGDLRPQLLDRFGLMVQVGGLLDPDERMAVIKAAEAWSSDPDTFARSHEKEQAELRSAIVGAQHLLPHVTIDDALIRQVIDACLSLGIVTHRAEIAVVRTARTLAAFRGRQEVVPADVREAMTLALPHRMRKKPFEEPEIEPQVLNDLVPDPQTDPEGEQQDDADSEQQGDTDRGKSGEKDGDGPPHQGAGRTETHGFGSPVVTAQLWKAADADRDRRTIARGRRTPVPTDDLHGRRTTTALSGGWHDPIAFDATLRAAAPHQRSRQGSGLAVSIEQDDLRTAQRRGRAEIACVFVVDASGSMGAKERMESAKGAVLSLLKDAYVHRDRIALVAFRGEGADVLLPLSRSVDLAYKRLADLPTGGRTPLAAGLEKGMDLLSQEQRKHREVIPMMMLISDGRGNSGSGPIREELAQVSSAIAEAGIKTVVVDTETARGGSSLALGYCREIAEMCGGSYYPIAELSADAIEAIARTEGAFSVPS